ncbi:MAG: hypothetical protein R6U17_05420 [Thermoplasmata archaeon]
MSPIYKVSCSYEDGCDWEFTSYKRDKAKEAYKEHIFTEHREKVRNIPKRLAGGMKCICGKRIRHKLPQDLRCPECGSDWAAKQRVGFLAAFSITKK